LAREAKQRRAAVELTTAALREVEGPQAPNSVGVHVEYVYIDRTASNQAPVLPVVPVATQTPALALPFFPMTEPLADLVGGAQHAHAMLLLDPVHATVDCRDQLIGRECSTRSAGE
jgi:hypothetical protein